MTISTALRCSLVRAVPVGAALTVAALGLAACSSSSSSTPTTVAPATTAPTTAPTTTGAPSPGSTAQNLPVTDAVRAELVAARAAGLGIAPSSFTGLTPGDTYYAFDPSTGTHWAAAQMQVPDTNARVGSDVYKAQVASQDDGSYVLFTKTAGGTWSATNDGSAGPGTAPCPVPVPAGVLQVWGWPAGTCRPAHY